MSDLISRDDAKRILDSIDTFCAGWRDYAMKQIDDLPSEPRWISVGERLPKEEKMHYWVCTDTGYQCQCRWTNDVYGLGASDRWEWKIFDIPQYQKVVAWMPLPEPWKGEEDE